MPVAIGSVFLTSAFAATATGTLVAGVIGSAIIGATVGGLTAAVTGGNIGKGLLFGAIGGAVMGGITGALGGFSGTTAGGTAGSTSSGALSAVGETSRGALSGTFGTAATEGAKTMTTEVVKNSAFEAGKFFATEGGGTIGASLLTTTGTTLAGAFDDSAEEAAKLEREKMKQQNEQFYANLAAQERIAGIQSGGSGGSDAIEVARINQQTQREQLAEQRRQYDTEKAIEEASRTRRAGALSGLIASKETGKVSATTPSIDQQAYDESTRMYAAPSNVPSEKTEGVLSYA